MEGDAKLDLWEIRLKTVPTIFRFWNGKSLTWQGNLYEGMACQLSGESNPSEGQTSRPILTAVNPENIFGPFAGDGLFDLAEVIRKRVLQTHIISNTNLFEQRVWICGRPSGVSDQLIQLELRSPTDMPAWKTPRRTYSPPDFPFIVS